MAEETSHFQVAVVDHTDSLLGRDVFIWQKSFVKTVLVKRGIRSPKVTVGETVAGRLALFHENWLQVTWDQWVLDTVMCYKIGFISTPTQQIRPRTGVCSYKGQNLVEEIRKRLAKGAITASRGDELVFFFEPLLSPQKGWRHEASHKLEEPHRACGLTTFQDGRDPHHEGFAKKRQLDDED